MPALRFVTPEGEQELGLGAALTIGRDPANGLPLSHEPAVSRRHAAISGNAEDGYVIEDLASRNGVMIERNGSRFRVDGTTALLHGDVILLGSTRLAFDATAEGSEPAAIPRPAQPAAGYVPEATRVGPVREPGPAPAALNSDGAGDGAAPADAAGSGGTLILAAAIVVLLILVAVLALTL